MYQWQITPNTNVMGATLTGIDLTQPMSMDEPSALKELLWDHQLLIIKHNALLRLSKSNGQALWDL